MISSPVCKFVARFPRLLWGAMWLIAVPSGVALHVPCEAIAQGARQEDEGTNRRGPTVVSLDSFRGGQVAGDDWEEENRDLLYAELADEASLLERLNKSVQKVSRVVRPSVVHIEASKFEKRGGRAESYDEAGSGVIIERGGQLWVLTNRHVVRGARAEEITLRLGTGRELTPRQVLADESTDIAILRLDPERLPIAKIGDSSKIAVGDFVVAVGSPFGLSHSVTFGIISATGRRDLTLGAERIELQDFFQTDAAINPGNSGGPLVNLRGEVIALNTAIASSGGGSEGIGFAIPIAMVSRIVDQLILFGHVRRGYLGVSLDPDFRPELTAATSTSTAGGARVKTVRENSPAVAAGLQPGDVILQFDGETIENDDHLVTRVGLTSLGTEVRVVFIRAGRAYQTYVRLVALPQQP